jgi:hypothetical protein
MKMASQPTTLTRHDLEARIVKHSWKDEAFRKEFIADPAGAFVRYLNVPSASLPKIVVHEEEPGSWHIVLPMMPANIKELSEEELERVAGGTPIAPTISVLATAAILGSSMASGITASAIVTVDRGW